MTREQLAGNKQLIEEQNRLLKERQEWALHTNETIRGLNEQLAAALAACEAKDAEVKDMRSGIPEYVYYACKRILAIKPGATALKAHDEALIEKIAQRMADSGIGGKYIAEAIRELKGML